MMAVAPPDWNQVPPQFFLKPLDKKKKTFKIEATEKDSYLGTTAVTVKGHCEQSI